MHSLLVAAYRSYRKNATAQRDQLAEAGGGPRTPHPGLGLGVGPEKRRTPELGSLSVCRDCKSTCAANAIREVVVCADRDGLHVYECCGTVGVVVLEAATAVPT